MTLGARRATCLFSPKGTGGLVSPNTHLLPLCPQLLLALVSGNCEEGGGLACTASRDFEEGAGIAQNESDP